MANKKLKAPVNIPVEKIRPFEGHPYKVLDNDEMNNLRVFRSKVFFLRFLSDLLKTQMNMNLSQVTDA